MSDDHVCDVGHRMEQLDSCLAILLFISLFILFFSLRFFFRCLCPNRFSVFHIQPVNEFSINVIIINRQNVTANNRRLLRLRSLLKIRQFTML